MQLKFYKYHGTGNDFVILDNRNRQYSRLTQQQIAFICHRHFGVGADGLMMLNTLAGYNFEMQYFNADGCESSMCGNGGRCLVQFANDMGIAATAYRFLAIDGEHLARIEPNGNVYLKMNDVDAVSVHDDHFVLNTGSPHYVTEQKDVMNKDIVAAGTIIRNSSRFKKEGINVNFVERTNKPSLIKVCTYERGVENETLSCGTGVTAAALVCFYNTHGLNEVQVQTKGGTLGVTYEKTGWSFSNIWLYGPAVKVFEGSLQL